MKKFDIAKTIQLFLYIIFTLICAGIILLNPDLYHLIGSDSRVRLICGLLWLIFFISFLFIALDFRLLSAVKKDFRELNFAVHSDPVSGIANRFSCDALIEKYLDQPLPENMGCIMFDLTNIAKINHDFGHIQGNILIRDFSNILRMSSLNLCFVGRNGGNKFLALFEDTDWEKIDTFLSRVKQKVSEHNLTEENYPIQYQYGIAFHEAELAPTVTDLIALSFKRIDQEHSDDRSSQKEEA